MVSASLHAVIPQDNVEAHMWLNLAASRLSAADRERTVATRDRVAERMTLADLSEAQASFGMIADQNDDRAARAGPQPTQRRRLQR